MEATLPTDAVLAMPEFRQFQRLMYECAGVRLPDTKLSLVENRLRRRLRAVALDGFAPYLRLLGSPEGAGEVPRFVEALTTNETFFFRHKQHWDFLLGTIVPEWRRQSPGGRTVRVWSAASSTGEEPYSLAIALAEALPANEGWRVSLEATDINEQVLATARAATYGEYALQKLTPLCIERYFEPCNGRLRVREAVRRMVRYSRHNLLDARRGEPCDLVLVRNVLIYFDETSKIRALGHIHQALKPGGWLILGGSESLPAGGAGFTTAKPTIFRRQP